MAFSIAAITANAQFFASAVFKQGAGNTAPNIGFDNNYSYFVGANGGYYFLKEHIPVSIGLEYGVIDNSNDIISNKLEGFRIPLKAGYTHYFNKFSTFVNVGGYLAFNTHEKIKNSRDVKSHFGILAEIGGGYNIYKNLFINVSAEFNRPVESNMKYSDNSDPIRSRYFIGGNIGLVWKFKTVAE